MDNSLAKIVDEQPFATLNLSQRHMVHSLSQEENVLFVAIFVMKKNIRIVLKTCLQTLKNMLLN